MPDFVKFKKKTELGTDDVNVNPATVIFVSRDNSLLTTIEFINGKIISVVGGFDKVSNALNYKE